MTSSNVNKARISVPASSANLGPGFDCLALALELRLIADVEWSSQKVKLNNYDGPLDWWQKAVQPTTVYKGTLAPFAEAHKEEPNLFAQAFVKAILAAGPEYHLPEKLTCRIDSDIPVAQGLGSSAAAIVAGAALAQMWLKGKTEPDEIFQSALEIEGHADNAAAATFGGLQAALLIGKDTRPAPLRMHESLRVAIVVPRETLKESTGATRVWLPESLKRTDAVSNQRALLTLLYGLKSGNPEAIKAGFEDRLHVPHRKAMIAGYEDIVQSGIEAGAFGVTISGAGGSMIALGTGDMQPVADAMAEAYNRHGMIAKAMTPEIAKQGLVLS